MFAWLKKLFAERDRHPKKTERGTITRTCKICGKTFTFPSNARHWPKYCRECRHRESSRGKVI